MGQLDGRDCTGRNYDFLLCPCLCIKWAGSGNMVHRKIEYI